LFSPLKVGKGIVQAMELLYVTSNQLKFKKAQHHLGSLGISLTCADYDFEELQGKDARKIVAHKLEQAYAHFHKPVLVSDDSWSIPALNGFPGAYMKDVNGWFQPMDWLRLMQEKDDQRIFLEAYLGYKDAQRQNIFHYSRPNVFLTEAKGEMSNAPHLTVIGNKTTGPSLAQIIAQDGYGLADPDDFWQEFATWLLH